VVDRSGVVNGIETRVDELEIRLTHQDKMIADLNDVLTAQWKIIETMQRQLRRLDEDLQGMDSGEAPPSQKPPHY
jgi:SlyX protein